MTTMNAQLGVVDESTYGTPVTVTRFFEFNSMDFDPQHGRTESKGLRVGTRTQRSDRFEPYTLGAKCPVELDVPTKGFGFWLKHMLGTVGTTGPTDVNYVHTGSEGSLTGDFFTMQGNFPFHPSGTNQPITMHGCKIEKWELGCDAEGVLVAKLDIDAEDYDTSTALATASYPTDYRIFSWAAGAVSIGGSSVEAYNFKVSCDNNLDTDRRYLRASPLKKEPIENGMRTYEWSCTVDFVNLTQFDLFRSATRAGALAAISATFDGPVAHGGTTLPRMTVTIPAARIDDPGGPSISGPEGLKLDLSGIAMYDGSASPVSLAYRTTDATP
jgi:hypothetical protein